MDRIVVVGPPCSGKTTVAAEIARHLRIPHVELDSLWWEPNWTEAGAERFTQRIRDVVEQPRWVLDGNYFSVGTREVVHPAADTIVWLDHGRWTTGPRAIRRTLERVIRRTELWSGNREPWSYLVRPDTFARNLMRGHPRYNRDVAELMESPEMRDVRLIRLCHPRAVRAWLSELGAAAHA